ncbi:MAG: carbohydrate ABC transporter permease [Halanaerobiales bacterium]
MSKKGLAYFLILPAFLALMLVHVIPMLWGVIISFLDLNVQNITRWHSAPFIGLDNFKLVFESGSNITKDFWNSILNVSYFALMTIVTGYLIGLGVALLLNKEFPFRTVVRGIILLPFITPDTVAFSFWRFIFNSRIGILNHMLKSANIIENNIVWLVGKNSIYAVAIASIWKGWPLAALMLLAALQQIPQQLYDAAKIDGANIWNRFRYVTFPYLKPVTKTLIIFNVLWNAYAYNQFYIMLGKNPGPHADIPALYIVRRAFDNLKYGQGAALSIVLLLLMLAVVSIMYYFFRVRAES